MFWLNRTHPPAFGRFNRQVCGKHFLAGFVTYTTTSNLSLLFVWVRRGCEIDLIPMWNEKKENKRGFYAALFKKMSLIDLKNLYFNDRVGQHLEKHAFQFQIISTDCSIEAMFTLPATYLNSDSILIQYRSNWIWIHAKNPIFSVYWKSISEVIKEKNLCTSSMNFSIKPDQTLKQTGAEVCVRGTAGHHIPSSSLLLSNKSNTHSWLHKFLLQFHQTKHADTEKPTSITGHRFIHHQRVTICSCSPDKQNNNTWNE